ncbi:MAG: glycine cleavage system protein GcvH [Nitriliruptoraceae bacterium]|nr:glycine cleavage system protein GcvH [Nitriliruptoraceae bacterium]
MSAPLPDDLRFTEQHEWVRRDGDEVVVGITAHAQEQLGDVVYVDLPGPGTSVQAEQPFGEVESHKSVSDLFAPVSGEISARNDALDERPELVNEDPYGEGWLVRITIAEAADLDGLLDAAGYRAVVGD